MFNCTRKIIAGVYTRILSFGPGEVVSDRSKFVLPHVKSAFTVFIDLKITFGEEIVPVYRETQYEKQGLIKVGDFARKSTRLSR
jgi:hypothetical protein